MIRAPSGIFPAQPVRISGAVPALVMVEHPFGDRVDAEALEHSVADLGVALEDEALRRRQWTGLAQDLLRDRELAEVVEAAREAGQLDLLLIQAEPLRDPGSQLGDAG